jgi:hypothetical protein
MARETTTTKKLTGKTRTTSGLSNASRRAIRAASRRASRTSAVGRRALVETIRTRGTSRARGRIATVARHANACIQRIGSRDVICVASGGAGRAGLIAPERLVEPILAGQTD